jgi:hypothetical protein
MIWRGRSDASSDPTGIGNETDADSGGGFDSAVAKAALAAFTGEKFELDSTRRFGRVMDGGRGAQGLCRDVAVERGQCTARPWAVAFQRAGE